MPWKTMEAEEKKVRFVVAASRQEKSLTALCEEFGISRPTGYLWWQRYRDAGLASVLSVVADDVSRDGRPDIIVANSCDRTQEKCLVPPDTLGVLLNTFTASTTTAITSSINPSSVNQPVTFTATITSSSPVPDGSTVTFYNGATEIGTGSTLNGIATFTTSFSAPKKYTIKASYLGDSFHTKSSGTEVQVVNR
jgi:transposase-like protein